MNEKNEFNWKTSKITFDPKKDLFVERANVMSNEYPNWHTQIQSVDLDGGDLGNTNEFTELTLIPFLIHRVANILSSIKHLTADGREFSYCIKTFSRYRLPLQAYLDECKLPNDVVFYSVDSRNIFEIRGASGGVTTAICFYLITKH